MIRGGPWRWPVRIVLAIVAVPLFYLAAAVIGSAIPGNWGRTAPAKGVRIFVADNGVHTDLILPVSAAGVDWGKLVRAEDISEPRYAVAGYRAFGWGDRKFYLETPEWSAMKPATMAGALFGSGGTVLHVAHMGEPMPGPGVRQVMLTPSEYRRLAGFVRDSFALGADGRPVAIPGYGRADVFYEARGGYSAVRTCNDWTGRALRTAGVRTGLWTPFPFGVMLWL